MRACLLVAILLGACGKATGGDARACEETAAHALGVLAATPTDPDLPPAVQAYMAEATKLGAAVMQRRCTADHWSAAAVACMKAATSQRELKACDEHLTATQRDSVQRDSQDAMRKLGKPKL